MSRRGDSGAPRARRSSPSAAGLAPVGRPGPRGRPYWPADQSSWYLALAFANLVDG